MTGEHGVTRDKVTWSSRFSPVGPYDYQLNSSYAWCPEYMDTNQWIQVR